LRVALLLSAILLAACSRQAAPPPAPKNDYVAADTCAGCHAKIAATYAKTGMARALYKPRPEHVKGSRLFHKASGLHFEIVEREGKFFQRRWEGTDSNVEELRIDYVMGSGNKVRTFLHKTVRGAYIELPLAWYSEKGGFWAMNPGYDAPHFEPRRKIGYDCMFCHNGYPAIPAGHDEIGAEPVFSGALPEGIDCQRCHGPGAAHVEAAQQAKPDPVAIRKAILNPSHLKGDQQMEVCMQCHLETTSTRLPNSIRKFDRGPYSYRAGEPLSGFMLFFDNAPGKGRDDKFEIVSSVYRLRKSRCFLKSNGALQCSTCHNPHDIPRGVQAAKHYNGTCLQCHAKPHAPNTDCISCHMPKRRTADVVHAVVTDHMIQRRKPAGDLLAALQERHDAAAYQGEVVPYYPAIPAPADALYIAAVQVNQQSNLRDGIAKFPKPDRAEFYIVLGDALKASGDLAKAAENYAEAVRMKPAYVLALKRLGVARRDPAILRKALETAPDNGELWYELGSLAADQGRHADAVQACEKATALDPDLINAHNQLGISLAALGDKQRAEEAFRAAIQIDPHMDEANGNLGNLLAAKGAFVEAEPYFERGPADALTRFNHGLTLVRMERFDEAQKRFNEAIQLQPNLAEAHELLGNLLERKHQTLLALAEYKEALRVRPSFARAHLDIGSIYAANGNRAAAIAELQMAAQASDPEVRQMAAEALKQLKP